MELSVLNWKLKMKNFEKTKKTKLVSNSYVSLARYGGINKLIKQKGNYKNDSENASYHSAPEKHGFYAFIYPYIEPFLLGGIPNGTKGRRGLTNKKNGRISHFGKRNFCKKFKAIDGYIWTHLEPKKQGLVIDSYGGWYKVHVKDLVSMIKKDIAVNSGGAYAQWVLNDNGEKIRSGLTIKSPYSFYSMDNFEVFICKDTILS